MFIGVITAVLNDSQRAKMDRQRLGAMMDFDGSFRTRTESTRKRRPDGIATVDGSGNSEVVGEIRFTRRRAAAGWGRRA